MDKAQIKMHDMERLAAYRDHLRLEPRLVYLFLELTDCCNLACRHCGSSCDARRGTFLDADLAIETLRTVAEDFGASTVMVCLTGGEPLVHPRFFDIVKAAADLGFPWGMTTNGTLIDERMAVRLAAAHMGTVTVSIDGTESSHDWLRESHGSYRRAVGGVRNLIARGFEVQVTTVVHNGNMAELEQIYANMGGLGVASWRLVNIEPIGRAHAMRDLWLSGEEFERLLSYVREKRFDPGVSMDVRFGCSHYLGPEFEREVRDNYFLCGSGIYVGSVLCNGDIYSCLDIERRPELVQGNVAVDRFSDVWMKRFREFREDRTARCGMCTECPDRRYCAGDSAHTWDYDRNEPTLCRRKGLGYESVRQA